MVGTNCSFISRILYTIYQVASMFVLRICEKSEFATTRFDYEGSMYGTISRSDTSKLWNIYQAEVTSWRVIVYQIVFTTNLISLNGLRGAR